MIPLYISGCFGVLHPGHGNRAALICGTLSDEALNSYRPLVFLAEQFAAADIPTLRLSHHGTGDSAGDDDEPERFNKWLQGVAAGVAWLRDNCGALAVTLIGHRVGASLAARAACDIAEVDSLVLLSPISGRQFLHEMTLAARISQRVWQTANKLDDGTWFESHGLRIDHATRDALKALDVTRLPSPPAARALWLEPEMRGPLLIAAEALQRNGTEVTFEVCDGLDRMQRDSHLAEIPDTAFAHAVDWVRGLPSAPSRRQFLPPAEPSLKLDAVQEAPIRFGVGKVLFGVLSLPSWPSREAPAVLLVNTSANPRWGNARIAVDLARALAVDGVASLRMDAAGMGDSAPGSGAVGHPYAEATTQDVLQAATELARRTQRPVVILGVCSGAYHALQAAGSDPRIAGLILINLQRFVWREGDPSDIVRRTDLRATHFYLRNLLSARAWLRLLRADFDVVRLARVLSSRLLRRGLAAIDPMLNVLPGGTRVGRVRRSISTLVGRNVPIFYVLGCNDPGVEELAAYFGRDGRRLRRLPNVTLRVLEGADHTLGSHALRATLIQEIRDWCRARGPAQPSGTREPSAGVTRLRPPVTRSAAI